MTRKALLLVAVSDNRFLLVDLLRVLTEYRQGGRLSDADYYLLFSAIVNRLKELA